jgi:hypothetical protein
MKLICLYVNSQTHTHIFIFLIHNVYDVVNNKSFIENI